MKKILNIFAACCVLFAAVACDKESKDPVNPVKDCQVPPTADVGGLYTITGNGFAADATFDLRDAAGKTTALEVLSITATEANTKIPSTLNEGLYTVVLNQDGSWDLGQVRLSIPNPVSNVYIPSAIKLNRPLEIAGTGFAASHKISLVSGTTRVELTTALSSAGVTCTIPSTVAVGNYDVILTSDDIDFVLASNVPAAVYKQIKKIVVGMGVSVDTENINMEALAAAIAQQYPEASEEEKATAIANQVETIKAAAAGMSGKQEEAIEFIYDSDGKLIKIASESDGGEYTVTNTGATMSGTETTGGNVEIKAFEWTIANGCISSSKITDYQDKSVTYTFTDNDKGYLASMTEANTKTFDYDDNGNFTGTSGNGGTGTILTYTTDKTNNIFAVDMGKALVSAFVGAFEPDQAFAHYLGLLGRSSTNLPTTFVASMGQTLEYSEPDSDGYVTKGGWSVTANYPSFFCNCTQSTYIEFVYE